MKKFNKSWMRVSQNSKLSERLTQIVNVLCSPSMESRYNAECLAAMMNSQGGNKVNNTLKTGKSLSSKEYCETVILSYEVLISRFLNQ